VKRYKLKKSELDSNQRKKESKHIAWYDWQLELNNELTLAPHPRKIIWYVDLDGNTGKTYFAKWRYQLDKFTAVVQGDDAKNIYHIISKRTNDTKTFIMDMSRSAKSLIDYHLIENVKNGYFQSGKYNSSMTIMKIPHVVIFANFTPKKFKLSLDRWDIRKLTRTGNTITVCKYDY
jgi:hypothetical protein